jgi:DNA-binding beta-propeller fold protein YncE
VRVRGGFRKLAGLTAFAALVLATAGYAATGGLTQKAGTAGCVSDDGTAGACQDALALDRAHGVTVSPDGSSVYVASDESDAVAVFDRNTTTGELTQKVGTAGCVSETGTGGACQDGVALDAPRAVAVSPDGASVYVASLLGDAVAIFDRNTTTGELTQKAGTAGCVSEDGTAGACQDGVALDGAEHLAVSPDGTSVYVASVFSDAVSIFDRTKTGADAGALDQKAGIAGCVSETGTIGACRDGAALDAANSLAVSSDGSSVYVTAFESDAAAVFDRNANTGELTQKAGTAGCVSEDGTAGACQDEVALDGVNSVAVSSDGTSVYLVSDISDAVSIFDRTTTGADAGALAQKDGLAGCVSETGTIGACQDGTALDGAVDVAMSPGGTSVYVASELNSVATLERNPTTGALGQTAGTAGCVSEDGTAGACQDGVALIGPHAVVVSPDGTSAYVASADSDAVAILDSGLTVAPPAPPDGVGVADTTPPDTAITKGPKSKTKSPKATFEFSSIEPGSTFECKLDDGAFEPCTSPHVVKAKKGKHTFEVRAEDAAGNGDATPATRSWKVKSRKKQQ